MSRLTRRLHAGLLVLLVPGVAPAQDPAAPWPCEYFVTAALQQRCLGHQLADADSALASLRRIAARDALPALDSLTKYVPPATWSTRPPAIRALLETRFRLELLRNLVITHYAQQDSGLRVVVPIGTRYRPDDGGNGIITFFTNYSNQPIIPAILVYSPHRDERRWLTLVVMQGRTTPYGWMQGWKFEPGDLIEVRLAPYRPRIDVVR